MTIVQIPVWIHTTKSNNSEIIIRRIVSVITNRNSGFGYNIPLGTGMIGTHCRKQMC